MISLKIAQYLVDITDLSTTITTDIIAYHIPLLLSKEAMKKANTKRWNFNISKKELNEIHFYSSILYEIWQFGKLVMKTILNEM